MDSLFSQTKNVMYLSVLYNDVEYKDNIITLFEADKFDEIYICTFVSSPKYFFKQTQEYLKIELLLGIEDNVNADKFIFDPKYTSDFFQSLPNETIKKITNNSIKISYTKPGITIHSKIYIQRNSKTNNTRIIIGSANYSNKAFANNNQFEELLVYDSDYNSKLTNYYVNRYMYIKENTLDFVPKYIRKKIDQEELKIITINNEESLEILNERLHNIQAAVILPDELGEDIQRTKKLIAKQEEDTKKELQSIVKSKQIIEIITKTTKNRTEFIKPAQFVKKKEQIITKVLSPTKVIKEFKDTRINLVYSEKDTHIFLKDEKSDILISFAQETTKEILEKKLKQLEKFIVAYSKYTLNTEEATQKRIFEAILYSFISPYMWKLRETAMWQQGRDEVKSGFPLFMLIAGMAQSGKTHLIKFISQIMGNHGSYFHYIKQAKLSSMNQANPQIIYQFFEDENLTPIFIDEINKEYFSSTSSATSSYMGEGFIKNLTNAKEGRHPCMIATSNTDFSANSQVMRRIYYIQLNNPFDSSKKVETAEYFTTLLNDFGTELYRDFLYRIEEQFKNGIEINVNDILAPARDIFKKYYEMLEIKTPSYYSNMRIDDYFIRGQEMWRDLYKMRHDGFKEDRKINIILLDDEIVFGTKMSANREKRELLQYLPIGVLVEEKGIVKLNLEKFFIFIDKKSKNDSLLKRYFRGLSF